MKKGRFANGPAEPRGFDGPWVDLPEGLLVELAARYASWSDFDMSEDAVEVDEDACGETHTECLGE